jgi:hypothetical protein
MQPMPQLQDQFVASIASEAVEVLEGHLLFPGGYLLPLSARGSGVPGMADRPWSWLTADVFYPNLPVVYSLTLRREPPDVLRGSLRARRTLFEGFFDRPKALLSPRFPAGQWWNFDLSSLREENRAIVHSVLAWLLYHAVTVGKQPMTSSLMRAGVYYGAVRSRISWMSLVDERVNVAWVSRSSLTCPLT